jgi:hypothetical protein
MQGIGFLIAALVLLVGGVGVAIVVRIVNSSLDRERITDYIRKRGGRVVRITWAPFGTGWLGDKRHRTYEVAYCDSAGIQHQATVKTNVLAGVFWTEDRIEQRKLKWSDSVAPSNESEELRRLREENARLKEQLGRREEEG